MHTVRIEVTGVLLVELPVAGPLTERDCQRLTDAYSNNVFEGLARELVVNGERVDTSIVSCSVKVQEPE